eukprot:scaffold69842_cov21-Tisochrysis_lutea.AAC.2
MPTSAHLPPLRRIKSGGQPPTTLQYSIWFATHIRDVLAEQEDLYVSAPQHCTVCRSMLGHASSLLYCMLWPSVLHVHLLWPMDSIRCMHSVKGNSGGALLLQAPQMLAAP